MEIEISNRGEIWISEILRRDSCNGRGYRSIHIGVLRINKRFYVHRLVAEAFIRKIRTGEEVNHIDFNRMNNSVSNLEIVSVRENRRWTVINGRSQRIIKYEQYLKILKLHYINKMPINKIIIKTGIDRSKISDAINGIGNLDYKEKYLNSGNKFKIKKFKTVYKSPTGFGNR